MHIAVVALGGNAIIKRGEKGTIAEQFANTRQALSGIIDLIEAGYYIIITHGNGPQVGNALIRVEEALVAGKAQDRPLGVCVADTEGGMGYMIEQSLQNKLYLNKIELPVVTILTQVVVDKNDPSIKNPTKPIGPFFTEEEAKIMESRGLQVVEDCGRGWRRVVPSPMPLEIVERETIKKLVKQGTIVIAAGGGGMPVYIEEDGTFEGIDAVIDKDLASSALAKDVSAELLLILTDVNEVSLNFGKPNQKALRKITVREAKQYLEEGHFPSGSMGPKIQAGIKFIEDGGSEAIITSLECAGRAIKGEAGTHIVK
ncbi:MAG: carbamate kinase [Candidatus Aenigmarchaeota archaeon]|nr:carbamate kinase [Candidatus Aenigmarchaeota archaeon]